ncbi:polyisoprenyl-teichoic acid--peptidoglycan teichoic acid transferase TagU [Bacillus massilinigeriensis]|uniref:polyisoprenyl-teichoic acid--peptidoglycan teichoic acid transferase TagU n=1 Tax=Bacillus massilionigeriensis TaxID=1805475 RepID=UPI00096B36FB|nr:LytR family transcriptional regulator [Bacillus massilionigeriensis]
MKKQNKKRKWLRYTGAALLSLLLVGASYAFYLYRTVEKTVANMQSDYHRDKSDKREEQVSLNNAKPFSVLLMGVDERSGDRGRSDTLIVMAVNPKAQSVKMISIPRDTRTLIVGRGTQDKINHSYAFGGEEMTVNTVENFLNIPVDYYIKMNMEGFVDIVDAVGGISVDNSFSFSQDQYSFAEGKLDLNGKEALAYARMRKKDPNGDFGRQQRQRQVIEGVLEKGANLSSVNKIDDILEAIGKNVETDLTFDEMKVIQKNYKEARHNIDQIQIQGQGTKINGIYYQVVPEQKRQEVISELKTQLEIK